MKHTSGCQDYKDNPGKGMGSWKWYKDNPGKGMGSWKWYKDTQNSLSKIERNDINKTGKLLGV